MSRARNIRRRNARRKTCAACRTRTDRLIQWSGLALCTGCYWIASTAGLRVLNWLGPDYGYRRRWALGVDNSSTPRVE